MGGDCGVLRIYAANGEVMRRSGNLCCERGKNAAFWGFMPRTGKEMPRSRDLCGKRVKNAAFSEDIWRTEVSELVSDLFEVCLVRGCVTE